MDKLALLLFGGPELKQAEKEIDAKLLAIKATDEQNLGGN